MSSHNVHGVPERYSGCQQCGNCYAAGAKSVRHASHCFQHRLIDYQFPRHALMQQSLYPFRRPGLSAGAKLELQRSNLVICRPRVNPHGFNSEGCDTKLVGKRIAWRSTWWDAR
jgi:hypothetical protein